MRSDKLSFGAAVDVTAAGLIVPIPVGPEAKIWAVAEAAKINIEGFRLVNAPHSRGRCAGYRSAEMLVGTPMN